VIEWIEISEEVMGQIQRKRIPLDPNPATYEFDDDTLKWKRSRARVSHFATCPAFQKNTRNNNLNEEGEQDNGDDGKHQHWWKRYD
jgi:hypothetical protein